MSALDDARAALAGGEIAAEMGWKVTWPEVRRLERVIRGLVAEIEQSEYTASEDIAQLPKGTILRDEIGRVFIRTDSLTYHWRTIWGPGYDLDDDQATTYTPVRVLYRPGDPS
jgi:hypothetical protein